MSLKADSDDVLDWFYHGTNPGSFNSVLAAELKSMGLLSIHLSETLAAVRDTRLRQRTPDDG